MSKGAKLQRRLRFESLEPRWTMDAQVCMLGDVEPPTIFFCETPATSASASQTDVQVVAVALNQFALDLYQEVLKADAAEPDDTVEPVDAAISPFSIAAALAMVYAGAKGETASQIARALHVDLPADRFHAAMGTLLQSILPAATDSAVQLETANSLWGQRDFELLASFRQLLNDRYAAEFHEVDFKRAPGEATDAINDWVRTQTRDMIKELFDNLSNETRLVLANALYFNANWATAFDPLLTERTVFHLAAGGSMDVSMMQKVDHFNYTETSDYQIAELPYDGGRYSMVVLLPKQTGTDLNANFSAQDLQSWLAGLRSTKLSLELPRFKLDTSMSLVETLQSLGITDAFDGKADFSGINGRRDLYISQAVHKAVVEVSETGTKAAAATGFAISVMTACMCSPPIVLPIPFHADHPFHFLIRDRQTNSILFLGQVQQPSAYDGNDPTAVELPKSTFQITTNDAHSLDVDADGEVTPSDALIVIDYLNGHPSQSSGVQAAALTGSYDVDGDGHIVPADALLIINRLNQRSSLALAQGEGESSAEREPIDSVSAVDFVFGLDELAMSTSDLEWQIWNRPAARRTR